jgi:hypothetical protein
MVAKKSSVEPFHFPPKELRGPHVTDRMRAIVYTSYLEQQLMKLVRQRLVVGSDLQCDSRREFVANIRLAHAIGLIAASEAQSLKVVARIRNLFAHGAGRLSFDSPDVKTEVLKLRWGGGGKDIKHSFEFSVWVLRSSLRDGRRNLRPIRPRRDLPSDTQAPPAS